MDKFAHELNGVLVEAFRSILKIEEKEVKKTEKMDLSIGELHLLEAVAKDNEKNKTISDLAEDLEVTLPSVTVAINKLVKKGYVEKIKSDHDGRMVYVVLTKMGKKMNAVHQYFHENMARNVTREFTEEEKEILLKAINKLNEFFKRRLEAEEHK